MKFAVINGSPKGENSVTLQYVNYLAARYPGHEFTIINAGARIAELETSPDALSAVADTMARAQAVIWSTPVYYMTVPAQLMRFIELLGENGVNLEAKRSFALVTSVHFYDHLALEYLNEISADLGMEHFGGFPAEMEDLLKPGPRAAFEEYFENFLWSAENNMRAVLPAPPKPAPARIPAFTPPMAAAPQTGARTAILVFDDKTSPAAALAAEYARVAPGVCEIKYIGDIDIKGGCLGCIRCGWDNTCAYKDGFAEFFKTALSAADSVVFALPLKGRFFPSSFKRYLDRSFFMGHIPTLENKPVAYLIAGDLCAAPAAQDFIMSYSETSGARLAGIVTTQSADIMEDLRCTALTAGRLSLSKSEPPHTYRAEGAGRIFRDMLYNMDFVFRADYLYYQKRGLFRFPTQNLLARAGSTMLRGLCTLPFIHNAFNSGMIKGMAAKHKDLVAKTKAK